MIKLAYALLMQDELDDAHDYYERVLRFGSGHSARDECELPWRSLICMGYVLLLQGELDDACTRKGPARVARNRSAQSLTDLLDSMSRLAWLYSKQGEFHEAFTLAEETLERLQRVMGPEHERTLRTQSALADALEGLKRISEARRLREEMLEHAGQNPSLSNELKAALKCDLALNIAMSEDATQAEHRRAIELSAAAIDLGPQENESCAYGARRMQRPVSGRLRWQRLKKRLSLAFEVNCSPPSILQRIDQPENRSDEDFQRLMSLVRIDAPRPHRRHPNDDVHNRHLKGGYSVHPLSNKGV